jgi:uncharacterized membrane protein YqgA involved in biofilm formation
MTGTYLNVITVIIGTAVGVLLGGRLPERLKQTVVAGLGLFTFAIGIQMFLKTQNPLVVLGSLVIGALLGEWWRIEEGLAGMGTWLEARFNRRGGQGSQERFVRGFLTASLLFCVGPMTILGSVQDGMTGDFELLAIKSVLDGFAALAFASSLGIGVGFSAVTILVYQGAISLLAEQVQALMSEAMMTEMTAAGGVILLGLALSSLLEVRKIRTGSFLPALVAAPVIVALIAWIGPLLP